MAEIRYTGLAEFGLPLVTRDDPSFDALVTGIEDHLGPGPFYTVPASEPAAVLRNDSGRAIVAMHWLWRYTSRDGGPRTSRFSSLTSSLQRDVLTGRSPVGPDLGTLILAGSKRLITERGMFGSNLDVLPPDQFPGGQIYGGGWGGGGPRPGAATDWAVVELVLDLVILEDGLCPGPDESALFEALNESLDLQQAAAQQAVEALQAGASVGHVFEIVRPLAQHNAPPRADRKPRHRHPLVPAFGNEAIHHLVHSSAAGILDFFQRAAAPRSLQLRRPGNNTT